VDELTATEQKEARHMTNGYESELAKKLNFKPGMAVHVVAQPADVDLSGLSSAEPGEAAGVLVFARTLEEAEARAGVLVQAAKGGMLTWVAYPKAGQLGTDLNRDILWKQLTRHGLQAVRQVAIDQVWSALRFKVG
jgi:hypothetical protein